MIKKIAKMVQRLPRQNGNI